jgi:NADP-dependent 3-hydroxy acid dehydrogenase YdfG
VAVKVIAITGGSAGIGRATAIRFARDGWGVAICGRRTAPLEQVRAEIAAAGGRPCIVTADVARADDMKRFVSDTVAQLGGLDIMMCNAGYGLYGTIDTIDPVKVQRVMEVNYMGTVHALQAALPLFRKQRRGHLMIISSIVGRRGVAFVGAYAATKFAQAGLAEALRAELLGSGIHVTTVFPISTETEFHAVMIEESGYATRASGPRQTPEDVAEAIARAAARPVPEVFPLRKSRALVVLTTLAPGLADRLVKRWGRKPIAAPEP